ncbi:hypothetical protein B0O99DRAFT_641003 [Bisporella sp. PMI_857]|nr:hypothetical protein B0O99DRAFT_641003 [Bisporella sp. PMI_857]
MARIRSLLVVLASVCMILEPTVAAKLPNRPTVAAKKGAVGANAKTAPSNQTATVPKKSSTLPDKKLPNCQTGQRYSDIKDMSKFWYDSGAEQYAQEYISMRKDHSNWAQQLYMDLFPDDMDHGEFSCITFGSQCNIKKQCSDFNNIGKGGLYYLFISMRNFHSFMSEFRDRLVVGNFIKTLALDDMKANLNISGQSQEPFNVFGLLSSALGIGSALAGANPIASGALGAMSGIMSILGDVTTPEPKNLGEGAQEALQELIKEGLVEGLKTIDDTIAAIFGKQGTSQNLIPQSMRKGEGKHAAVQVFGYGQWLLDHPNISLEEYFKGVATRMNQGLAWQMARMFKKTYVIIRDDMKQKDCVNPNNAWHSETGRCLDMMTWGGASSDTFGGANDLTNIWVYYKMNQLATMLNSVQCWEQNNGQMGASKPGAEFWKSDGLPPCFFGSEVKKGTWEKDRKGVLYLDSSFVGQTGATGLKIWPETKCPKC